MHDQVKFLIEEPEISVVGAGADAFREHEGVYSSSISHSDIKNEFLVNNPFFHPTIMFRRELADQGLYRYDESHTFEEDYDLWRRLLPQISRP